MAKNYADIYNSDNVSIALEQRWYVKEETTRGELVSPTGADFLYTLGGGSIEFSQPFESSPHRSGRHHTSEIKKKKECSWGLSTYFNIDTTLGSAGVTEIDPAMRVLWKSLLGKEVTSSGLQYTPTVPNLTFSMFEVGDKWSRQARGCFVQSGNAQFPGDGEATTEWSGNAKDAFLVGIGKSVVSNNTTNIITVGTGEGERFKKAVGAYVMIIEANGTTRSADTPDGSPRKITNVTGDAITVDGAVLADADGSVTPIYLCYYEPATPVGINNPQTGLTGSLAITGLAAQCIRSASLNMVNDHELQNYCYGSDSLSGMMFTPGNRFTATLSVEMNLNDDLVAFLHDVENFEAQVIQLILGDVAGRHLDIDLPKVKFPVPAWSVPDTGSIPITFEGTCYQSALDTEDEVSLHFK